MEGATASGSSSAAFLGLTSTGEGKCGTQAAKEGGRRSERGCLTAVTAADALFLSYNDPDPGNPVPAFAAP